MLIIGFLSPLTVYAENNDQLESQEPTSSQGGEYSPNYNILPIILIVIILYLVTYLIYDTKIIKRRTFKQIWSIILVACFLFSGISGIILSILSDYALIFPLGFNLLFWHVELSIIMAITSILHIHIYWKAFKRL
ncbi:hypothetical protein [Methanobacterium oryzae]|uniref:hypothetical protein n=1 Tax=Methanobacterium oryzae TaxID=69540 RepID=UPI003D1CB009